MKRWKLNLYGCWNGSPWNFPITLVMALENVVRTNIFTSMFPDSKIAKEFVLGHQKLIYWSTYVITSYLKSSLKSEVDQSPIIAVSFDEGLNQFSQTCEIDVVRYWDVNGKTVKVVLGLKLYWLLKPQN